MTNSFPNFAAIMATSIKLIRRYVWLAETIRRAGRITIDEINSKWSHNSTLNDNHEPEIPERTFHRHREAIADIFGIDIQCDRKSNNEYYIENPEILDENSFTSNLFSRLAVDNRLLDNRDLSERILDEKAAPGTSLLPLFIDALQQRLRINMIYHSQYSGKTRQHTIEPQFLKNASSDGTSWQNTPAESSRRSRSTALYRPNSPTPTSSLIRISILSLIFLT